MLTILLPSLSGLRLLDPLWAEEAAVAQARGYDVALLDTDARRLYQLPPDQPVLYRGWMLTEADYRWLETQCQLLVPFGQYAASHRANGWYEPVRDFTPASRFVPAAEFLADWEAAGAELAPQFVKGLVKSFGADSRVASVQQARQLLQRHALAPEELLFVREFVELAPRAEQRYFAVGSEVFGAGWAEFPAALRPAAEALGTRLFYTVDVAYTHTGRPVIIEVGDGQVSDTKEWLVQELYDRVILEVDRQAREMAA